MACKKDYDEELFNDENLNTQKVNFFEKGIKLLNPYSVDNMKTVFNNLYNMNTPVRTTHYYVKFNITTEKELSIVKQDSALSLYDFPLDYKFNNSFDFKSIKDISDKYCAVDVNYIFPKGVSHEILANLYLPEDDLSLNTSRYNVDEIVNEALRLTGNLEENQMNSRRPKWTPKGKIMVWDDYYHQIKPVEGVKVKARRWFRTSEGITGPDGSFVGNRQFRRPARYSLDWERYDFKIRDSWLHGAKCRGPKIIGDWNSNFIDGEQKYFATIFKAAYYYYYKDIVGIQRPPQNGWFHTQLKFRAKLEGGPNGQLGKCHVRHRFLGLGNHISITSYSAPSHITYAVVIHELAHASHWKLDRYSYNHLERNTLTTDLSPLTESWATGVEVQLARKTYPNYVRIYSRRDYTGIVEDLIDGTKFVNSSYVDAFTPTHNKSYSDLVVGYDLKTLEAALKGCKSLKTWQLKIVYNYENTTENHVHEVFTYWGNK